MHLNPVLTNSGRVVRQGCGCAIDLNRYPEISGQWQASFRTWHKTTLNVSTIFVFSGYSFIATRIVSWNTLQSNSFTFRWVNENTHDIVYLHAYSYFMCLFES